MKQIFLMAVVVLMLAGCGATVGLGAKTTVSTFDGSRNVWIDTHGTNCGMSMVCSQLGAQWTSSAPDRVILNVGTMGAYENINAAALNIDGQVIALQPAEALTHFGEAGGEPSGRNYNPAMQEALRTSTQGFVATTELVRKVLASRSVKLRVQTSEGTIDSVIIDGPKDSKAYYALQRFMTQVERQ